MRSMGSTVLLALVAGALWGCDGERVMQPQVEPRPLGKVAADGAVVVGMVTQDGAPVSGVLVEFSRSIAGRAASYEWSATTDENGRARIEITAGNGYYQARAMRDGREIGSWLSIPLNASTEVVLDLPIGERAQVMRSSGVMPPSTAPRDLTRAYVEAAIVRYGREGLEATVAHYDSRESLEGQLYLFLIDENDLYLAHPIFPHLKGTDIKDVVGSDGQKLGEEIAQATEAGHWVDYLWPNPVTGVEEPKSAWVIRHDGIIFASGYYTPDPNAEPHEYTVEYVENRYRPWPRHSLRPGDPATYTVGYVERAIARYERDGLEAMKNYYNSVASFEGQWYLFATDANDLYIVHPLFSNLIGTDIKNVERAGYELGKALAKATEDGIWVEYLWPHPLTLQEVPKATYAVRHDGLIFASGYYSETADPRAYTLEYAAKAIDLYEREGLDATVAYYNSAESVEGQWFLVMLDAHYAILAHPLFQNLIGMESSVFSTVVPGFPGIGEMAVVTEEGKWFQFPYFNPSTSEGEQMHLWVVRHDGLIFAAGYSVSE